jgi:hypothetical protein
VNGREKGRPIRAACWRRVREVEARALQSHGIGGTRVRHRSEEEQPGAGGAEDDGNGPGPEGHRSATISGLMGPGACPGRSNLPALARIHCSTLRTSAGSC